MARGLELGAQIRVVVDLAVEDDLDGAVFVAKRLRPRRQVDDAQSPVPERGTLVAPDARVIGPAVRDYIAHTWQSRSLSRPQPVACDNPRDPAHA